MAATELLERDHVVAVLERALDNARSGRGRVVVVSGPAGIGKSAVVGRFLDARAAVRQITGRCDDLSIPRAFGPFADAASRGQIDPAAVHTVDTLGRELLTVIAQDTTIVALDDVHWADQGSADMVALLGRRIHELPCVLIVTMRDEPTPSPARAALGSLPAGITERVVLEPLSADAIARLVPAGSDVDPDHVHRIGGGNPFLTVELLRSPDTISGSIRDRYTATVGTVSPAARHVVQLLAVSPHGCSWPVLEGIVDDCHAAVDELERTRLAVSTATDVRFDHELARRAVEAELSGAVRRRCHVDLLGQLTTSGDDPALIAHHAAAVGDVPLLVTSSIDAAQRSADAGAHVDALQHIERVLPHADHLAESDLDHLYEIATIEYQINMRLDEALAMAERRIDLAIVRRDPTALSAAYRGSSLVLWAMARATESDEALQRAVDVLENEVSSIELSRRYADVASNLAMQSRWLDAADWLERTRRRTDLTDDQRTLGRVLGTSEMVLAVVGDPDEARAYGDRAIDIFRREGIERDLLITVQNRVATALNTLRIDECPGAISDALAALEHNDSVVNRGWLTGLVARYELHVGDWDAAERHAGEALEVSPYGLHRVGPLIVHNLLRARRGDGPVDLGDVRSSIERLGDIQRVGQVATAMAEVAWLGGEFDQELFERAERLAATSGYPRFIADLAVWRQRLFGTVPNVTGGPEPLRADVEGRWLDAAEAWRSLGCGYEQALTLAFSGDHDAMQEGAQIARQLGATAASDRIRQMLRDVGVLHARGPRAATRSNPAGLTNRQVQVAELLADGLTNAEIAERLFVSAKTVDHHVSAVLAKLGAANRREAGAVFTRLANER